MGSSSLGVSVIGWGASGGTTWRDGDCVRRLNARELAQTVGDREAARQLLCGDRDIYRVYEALGRPCALKPDGKRNPEYRVAAANEEPTPVTPPPEEAAPEPAAPPPPPPAPPHQGERGVIN